VYSLSLQDIARAAERSARDLGFDRVTLWLKDQDGRRVSALVRGSDGTGESGERIVLSLAPPLTRVAEVATARRRYFLTRHPAKDLAPAERRPLMEPVDKVDGYAGCVLVPLMGRRGNILGVLMVGREKANGMALQESLPPLQALAHNLAIVIENTRLLEKARRHAAELAALNEITASVTQVRDMQEVLNLILERLECVISYESAFIKLLEGREARIVAQRGSPVSLDPARSEPEDLSWIEVPLSLQGQVIGCICLGRREANAFRREEVQLAQVFANHAAVAIRNARLYEALQRYSGELEAQVAARTADLQVALERAQEADRLKSAFLSTISHELRTPLAVIKGFVSTLLQNDVQWEPEMRQEFLATIEREADHLTGLIEQLLDMSRLEAGVLAVDQRPCRLQDVYANVADRLQLLARDHRLRVDFPDDLPLVHADLHRVGQVLSNLVENAAKYSPAGSEIVIRAVRADGQVLVSVTDQGEGIAPEFHERIFERFFRVQDEPSRSGTGLGLAICRGIVEAHGGRIWVESVPEEGSTFSFTLPIIRDSK
ncbi:MAG: GAF domain-containing protein, partial [Anaerolineae bacterium]|nr:GAF domain-containing protein [Anaerolineae bacterium]